MISVSDIRKTYDRHTSGANEVLHGLSFELPDTGFICILGSSGSGKTSLLNAIGGLDRFDSGTVNVDGVMLTARSTAAYEKTRNSTFGYIFQNYYLLSEHSAAYNVYLGLHTLKLSRKEKLSRVMEALKKVGMERYFRKNVGEMSGGQQQRVAIARAIARRPKVIFADEPTGNLDRFNTVNICTLLKDLSRDNLIIMVTHEEGIANFFADRIIRLEDGRIAADESSWERSSIDNSDINTFYTGEYNEARFEEEKLSLRLLSRPDSAPLSLTVIVENDRIVIKSNDGRVLLSSSENEPPFIAEGNKPRLEAAASVTGTGSEGVRSAADGAPAGDAAEAEQAGSSEASASNDLSAPHDLVKNTGRGLEFGLLLREALGSRSGKRLQNIGTVLFLILLSFMLCLTAADTITISHIDPEDFILSDSHILDLQFSRGNEMTDLDWHIPEYTRVYIDWLAEHDQEVYFIPTVSGKLCYKDDTVPQYGSSAMYFSNYSYVPVEILDPESLITGRMPERYDEIVLDRWVLDKALAEPGVVPNIIPNSDYLLGKQIFIEKKDLILTISGICDSGEPSVYVSKLLLFALGNSGDNVVTYSEFIKITGDTSVPEPEPNQCYSLTDNTGSSYIYSKGYFFNTKNGASFKIAEALETPTAEYGLMAKFVIRDDALDDIYRASVADTKKSSLWCRDKAATRQIMDNEPLPENIDGLLNVIITDRYTESNTNYRNAVAKKVSARFIVTLALAVLSVIMLYLLQRSRIVERMELVAVYRLLGLPKRDAVGVFVLESVFQTLKYSLPVILITWGVIELLGISGVSNAIHLPLWGALATLAAILLIRILFAMLPAIRLMLEPPARLAAKHDF